MSQQWLPEAWANELTGVLQMMLMQDFSFVVREAAIPSMNAPAWWSQAFNIAAEHPALLGAPESSWNGLGRLALETAGIDEVDDETARGTYLEIVQQSVSAIARIVTKKLGKTVEAMPGSQPAAVDVSSGYELILKGSGGAGAILFLAIPAALQAALEPAPSPAPANTTAPAESASESQISKLSQAGPATPGRPIELLLDVEMPVSISFGQAHLPLKDVLKFTAGSVVELNRHPDEPVDIVVNNCVIARGEVVVVDGNYGVRIQEIVSRQQRLAMQGGDRAAAQGTR